MLGFLKSLCGFTDRSSVAADRAATAMEGIASDLESVRERIRGHFGLSDNPDTDEIVVHPKALNGRAKR